jgi:hypothetical protein
MAAAYDLEPLDLVLDFKIIWLCIYELVENTFSSLMAPLDLDNNKSLAASINVEWKISRRLGVSIFQVAPHSQPNTVFVILVSIFSLLPPTLTLIVFVSFSSFTVYHHLCSGF